MKHYKPVTIRECLEPTTLELIFIITQRLNKLGISYITDHDNYIYFNGGTETMLVAHMDTCIRNKDLVILENNGIYTAKDSILGADDRAGIYAILKILESGLRPSFLFTNYEESGLIGVRQFIKEDLLNTDNLKLFVEIDRQGCNDFVFYSSSLPTEVKYYAESFGFVETWGILSDVQELTEKTRIPHINVSAGYYNQHSTSERLHLDELELTISRVIRLLNQPIEELYEVQEVFDSTYGYGYYPANYGIDYEDDVAFAKETFSCRATSSGKKFRCPTQYTYDRMTRNIYEI